MRCSLEEISTHVSQSTTGISVCEGDLLSISGSYIHVQVKVYKLQLNIQRNFKGDIYNNK